MGVVTELTFLNLAAETYDFLALGSRVKVFRAKASPRGENRSRMQMHGRTARIPFFDGLDIHMEGLVLDPDPETVMAQRSLMLTTILGDLSAPPTDTKLGTLTVRYANWAESASADVLLEDYEAEINADSGGKTLPWMFAWAAFEAYFTGDISGNPVIP